MLLGYNTNGFAHHRLEDALTILAELGYQSIALTLDVHALNPFDNHHQSQLGQVSTLLKDLSLRCVIETGSRFLLDPWRKHQPTLLSTSGREQRIDFLCRSIDIAAVLKADAVSFWSGTPSDSTEETELWDRLTTGCHQLCDHAEQHQVRLAFEPEPGMFIDTMARFEELMNRVSHPLFGLTLDVGHLHCLGEFPIEAHIHRWSEKLWNIHIEDMRRGVHDHLMFGEGEMSFPPIFRALKEIDYQGGLHVELSRHSHQVVDTARRALEFLRSQV